VTVRIDPDTTKFYVPDLLVCRIKVDPELVLLCQSKGGAKYKGVPIGQMKSTWPHSTLKAAVKALAMEFVLQMDRQGNVLQTDDSQIEIWGPYRDRPLGVGEVNIEAGNHTVPEGKMAFDSKGVWSPEETGPREITQVMLDRHDFRHGICYRIRGKFLKTRGKQDETGLVIL